MGWRRLIPEPRPSVPKNLISTLMIHLLKVPLFSNITALRPRLPVYEPARDKLYQIIADRKVNISLERKDNTVNHLSEVAIKGNEDEHSGDPPVHGLCSRNNTTPSAFNRMHMIDRAILGQGQ